MKNMIIGQFGEAFPPINDGVAHVIENYAEQLHTGNDKCYVVTTNVPGAKDDYPFDVLRYKSYEILFKSNYRTGFPKLDRRFMNNLKNIDFDIIHSHSPFSAGVLGLEIAKKLRIPGVITFHSKFRQDFEQVVKSKKLAQIMLDIVMPAFHRADDVWTVSESAVETLREYGYKGEVFITKNACDFTHRIESDYIHQLVNRKYNIDKTEVVFAFVGQLTRQKNTIKIMDAVKELRDRGYAFKMLFVGEGDRQRELMRMSKHYTLNDRVIFTGNVSDRDMLKSIYLRSRTIVFPSLYDVSSLVIKEAAAMSCPMILAKNSTTAQGIIDGYNGFLTENNVKSIADSMEYAYNNPETLIDVGKNAFKTLYVSWEQSVAEVRDRYKYLLAKR